MATGTLAPEPRLLVLDSTGNPISGAKLYTFLAGTTTPAPTYNDVSLMVPNSNPMISDGYGRIGPIFLSPGASYKFVLQNPDSSSIWTQDNISSVPGSGQGTDVIGTAGEAIAAGDVVYLSSGSGGKTAGLWYEGDSANTYSSTTPIIGMAPAAISAGSSGTIRLQGSVTGLSSLVVGTTYYIGTAGALTAIAPTNARNVGIADTTSSIVLVSNPFVPVITIADNGINDFRLTLTTGVPVTSTDVTAATTIYLTPYKGNRIDLLDSGGLPTRLVSAEVSIAVPATTTQMYDIFAFNSGGVPTLELLAWTNDTTRATALVLINGILTKTGNSTRRYLGSFRTTGVSGQTTDAMANRYLWNYYNRAVRLLRRIESTANWAYVTATVRQANAAVGNQIDIVNGIADSTIVIALHAMCSTTVAGVQCGIGEDVTNAFSTNQVGGYINLVNGITAGAATLNTMPAVGRHFYAWLEKGNGTDGTWYGANSTTLGQSGLSGTFMG